MNKTIDLQLAGIERRLGMHAPDPLVAQQAKALDDWLAAVTGKTINAMSCTELERLEALFRASADAGEPMGDDAAELVRSCMDVNQTVIDLDLRRQQLDTPPWR